jgi:hypothetical protein
LKQQTIFERAIERPLSLFQRICIVLRISPDENNQRAYVFYVLMANALSQMESL